MYTYTITGANRLYLPVYEYNLLIKTGSRVSDMIDVAVKSLFN